MHPVERRSYCTGNTVRVTNPLCSVGRGLNSGGEKRCVFLTRRSEFVNSRMDDCL